MKITVGGDKKEVAEGLTVAALIEQENVETPQYVTVSVNEEFIDSGSFDTHVLNEDDEVEFLYFMGGGALNAKHYLKCAPTNWQDRESDRAITLLKEARTSDGIY